ncbi:hypothetical protein BDW72DRAFT_64099 [Aspergillus terricola var. indicus]
MINLASPSLCLSLRGLWLKRLTYLTECPNSIAEQAVILSFEAIPTTGTMDFFRLDGRIPHRRLRRMRDAYVCLLHLRRTWSSHRDKVFLPHPSRSLACTAAKPRTLVKSARKLRTRLGVLHFRLGSHRKVNAAEHGKSSQDTQVNSCFPSLAHNNNCTIYAGPRG